MIKRIAIILILMMIITPSASAASCYHTKLSVHRVRVERDNFVDVQWKLRTDFSTIYTTFRITDDKGQLVVAEPTQGQAINSSVDGVEFFDQLPLDTPARRTYTAWLRVSDGHGCTTDSKVRFKTR